MKRQKRTVVWALIMMLMLGGGCSLRSALLVRGDIPPGAMIEPTPTLQAPMHQELVENTSRHTYSIQVDSAIGRSNTLDLRHPKAQVFEINRLLRIENIGRSAVKDPYVVINGKGDWRSVASILSETIQPGMSDRDKALAIWNFVRQHQYGLYSLDPEEEQHDPVKYFNVYGYGLCDDNAAMVVRLAKAAGFDARMIALNGHVVSEVFFDGQYHVLDADPNVNAFYLLADNHTLASAAQLAADPIIAQHTHRYGPYVAGDPASDLGAAQLYGADDRVLDKDFGDLADWQMTLRPGELFEWRWDNIGKYHANPENGAVALPPYLANGKWAFHLNLDEDTFIPYMEKIKNIATFKGDGQLPKLHLKNPQQDGHLLIKVESPYVIVGARLKGSFYRPTDKDVVKLYASRDNDHWQRVFMAQEQTGNFPLELSLDDWIAPINSQAMYHYYLMIEFIGADADSRVGANDLVIESDVQMALDALPALQPGDNNLVYTDSSQEEHQVLITHQWQEDRTRPAPDPPDSPVFPLNEAHVQPSRWRFAWKPAIANGGGQIVAYYFIASRDPNFNAPISPNFERLVTENFYEIPLDGLLNLKTPYYWRVRSLDNNGVLSPWSATWRFYWEGGV